MNQAVKWTLAAVVLSGVVGCESTPKPKPMTPAPTFVMPPTRAASVAVLMPAVGKFNDDISHFPGVNGAEHRKTLAMALDDLDKILRLINGPDQSPGLTTDLAIITAARDTANIQSIPRDRMVAVENQGLQATTAALKELSTRYLLDKDQLPALVETLNTKVSNVAGVTGTMHDLDATDCFQAVAAVVVQIANDLHAMVPEAPAVPDVTPPLVTPPPVTPVTPPATVPVPAATAPTTAPAPMPAPTPAP